MHSYPRKKKKNYEIQLNSSILAEKKTRWNSIKHSCNLIFGKKKD